MNKDTRLLNIINEATLGLRDEGYISQKEVKYVTVFFRELLKNSEKNSEKKLQKIAKKNKMIKR
jgi:hypothetical protein